LKNKYIFSKFNYSKDIGFSALKYRSSKIHVFLFFIKTVFPMFNRISELFVEVRMHLCNC